MTIFSTVLSWIQTGEPLSAGFEGGSSGVMNRPLKQLLNNDKNLQDRIISLEEAQFLNKMDDFYFDKIDRNKCFRLNDCDMHLPQMFEEDDGIKIRIIKVSGTVQIVNPFSYFPFFLLGDTLINNTEQTASLLLEYVYPINTWVILSSTGTWGVA